MGAVHRPSDARGLAPTGLLVALIVGILPAIAVVSLRKRRAAAGDAAAKELAQPSADLDAPVDRTLLRAALSLCDATIATSTTNSNVFVPHASGSDRYTVVAHSTDGRRIAVPRPAKGSTTRTATASSA